MGSLHIPPTAASEHHLAGNEMFKRKAYPAAIASYTSAAQEGPSADLLASILCNRALAYYRTGDYTQCLSDCSDALALADVPKARYRAALACLMLNDGADAEAHLEIAAGFAEPPNVRSLRERASALAQHQRAVAQVAAAAAAEGDVSRLDVSDAAATEQALQVLSEDLDGESDVDVLSTLETLAASLQHSHLARAVFEARSGYRLIFFYFTDACCTPAAAVLRAAGSEAALWPSSTWQRLVSIAASSREPASVAAAALALLRWAAQQSAWVRCQLLTHPLLGHPEIVPLTSLVQLRGGSSTIALRATAALLSVYGGDSASASALAQLSCRPLEALLVACAAADDLASSETPADSAAGSGGNDDDPGMPQAEREALQQLREKQRAVYNASAVALRFAALRTFCTLCSASAELITAEAVARRPSKDGKGGRIVEGPLIPALLKLVQGLHEASPKRTAPVLGLDGQPKAYAKRPFAADFKDNPAGDFLAGLDLNSGPSAIAQSWSPPDDPAAKSSAEAAVAKPQQHEPQLTALELALQSVLHVASCGAAAAALLHRRGALRLCEDLFAYVSPGVVQSAQAIYAAVCDACQAARSDALASSSLRALAALALRSGDAKTVAAAMDKLAGMVDSCTGDELAELTARDGAMWAAYELVAATGAPAAEPAAAGTQDGAAGRADHEAQEVALRLLRLCAERVQRVQGLARGSPPRGPAWDRMGKTRFCQLLTPPQATVESCAAPVEADGLCQLKRGFLGGGGGAAKAPQRPKVKVQSSSQPPEVQQQQQGSAGSANSSRVQYGNGVTIEEMEDDAQDAHQRQPHAQAVAATAAGAAGADDDDEDIPALRDVYDSSHSSAAVRTARSAWLAIPPQDRLRWSQTSTDISAWFTVPAGTRANEVSVNVTPDHLTVSLAWYGRVADGELHRRVKAADSRWCLEDGKDREDSEVHVMLPKDGAGSWWKSVFEGGQERTYQELLREAVEADEPAVPFDEMDEGARGLLDSILERQAYVYAGLIDLENGFDDFRVVIGESSLGPEGGAHNRTRGSGNNANANARGKI